MKVLSAFAIGLVVSSIMLTGCSPPGSSRLPIQGESQRPEDKLPIQALENINDPVAEESTRLLGEVDGDSFFVGSTAQSPELICLIAVVDNETYSGCADQLPIRLGADDVFEAQLSQQRPSEEPGADGQWIDEHLWVSIK